MRSGRHRYEQLQAARVLPVVRRPVHGTDLTRLVQVFFNLLINAAKYTPAQGHIAVTAAARARSLS
jgi:signal transduction histidine kinase